MKHINLRLIRAKHGYTQKRMADEIGVTLPTYSEIELGKRDGTVCFWKSVQQRFKIPDGEMWGFIKNEEKDVFKW